MEYQGGRSGVVVWLESELVWAWLGWARIGMGILDNCLKIHSYLEGRGIMVYGDGDPCGRKEGRNEV